MKSVFKIKTRIVLKSGDVKEYTDYISADGGMMAAARRAQEYYMKLRFRDSDHEWSDVVRATPLEGTFVCDLLK